MPTDERRLYKDLAWLWPVFSPPRDYVEETEFFARAIKKRVKGKRPSLLHLGCGGGHNDYTFKKHFKVTGIDTSDPMLALARKLNPENEYVRGDMRSVNLHRRFDAVFIGDSVAYMLTERDLARAFATAYRHLGPGGVMLVVAEFTKENFRHNKTTIEENSARGIELTVIENDYDPDPSDTTFEGLFVYLVRKHGKLKIYTDRHLAGVFRISAWEKALCGAGFKALRDRFDHSSFEEGGHMPMYVGVKRRA